MTIKSRKRIAARILKVGINRVKLDPYRLDDIKEGITKEDIRELIKEGAIKADKIKGVSKGRFRKRLLQKKKGMRKGPGSRRGKRVAKKRGKAVWMKKVRVLRRVLSEHKKEISKEAYWRLRTEIKANTIKDKKNLLERIKEMKK